MDKYMVEAIKLSRKAALNGDVPVGAVLVENGKIIAKSYNKKFKNNDVTAHAELLVIKMACKRKKTTYLNNCELYVTLEPCMMCTSAIEQAHISKVIFCLKSPKYGHLIKYNGKISYEEQPDVEYENSLKAFFKDKR